MNRQTKPTWTVFQLLGLVIAVLCVSNVSLADDVPADRQALILLRAIAYDGNLAERAGDQVTIAVLYNASSTRSSDQKTAIIKAFKANDLTVKKLPVKMIAVSWSDVPALEAKVKSAGVDTIYVARGMSSHMSDIQKVAEKYEALVLSGSAADMSDGVCLGLRLKDKKPKLVVHRSNCEAQGVEFSSKLLKLAESAD